MKIALDIHCRGTRSARPRRPDRIGRTAGWRPWCPRWPSRTTTSRGGTRAATRGPGHQGSEPPRASPSGACPPGPAKELPADSLAPHAAENSGRAWRGAGRTARRTRGARLLLDQRARGAGRRPRPRRAASCKTTLSLRVSDRLPSRRPPPARPRTRPRRRPGAQPGSAWSRSSPAACAPGTGRLLQRMSRSPAWACAATRYEAFIPRGVDTGTCSAARPARDHECVAAIIARAGKDEHPRGMNGKHFPRNLGHQQASITPLSVPLPARSSLTPRFSGAWERL